MLKRGGTVAIVPMRHNSERVPGKNYRPLGGIPLYRHIVATLFATPGIDKVVIDTDSDTIIDDAEQNFPGIQIVVRPESLRSGDTAMTDVLKNTLSQMNPDLVIQTHSTSPFLRSATIQSALDLLNASEGADSCFSVTRIQARLWGAGMKPLNHDPDVLLRTQDLAPIYLENSGFYIFKPSVLFDTGRRIGIDPIMFELSSIEAIDIDIEEEFILSEAVASSGVAL